MLIYNNRVEKVCAVIYENSYMTVHEVSEEVGICELLWHMIFETKTNDT